MIKYRLYPIVIIFALVSSIILPRYYNEIFGTRIDYTRIKYSPISEDFLKSTYKAGKYRKMVYSNLDETKKYTFEEYEELLPFLFLYDLVRNDKFPEKFIAYAQDRRFTRSETTSLRLRPANVNIKGVELYPLMESKPNYSLKYPNDLFRLGKDGIVFIDLIKNQIDKKKSKEYSKEFLKAGAVFPLKRAFGNPSTMKSFDEGYFISDAKNQYFHLKRVDNKAHLYKVPTKGMKIKYIQVKEDKRKEYYGFAIGEDNSVYLLMYDNYEFVKLPIKDYDYKKSLLQLNTNPINRIITVTNTDYEKDEKIISTFVTNLDYELLKKNKYSYSIKNGKVYETFKSILFPYKLSIVSGNENYANFKIRDISYVAFIISFIIAFLYLLFVKKTNRCIKEHIINGVLIFIGGIYTIIPLILFGKILGLKKVENEKN